jgi:molecular chaperone GrpE
VVNDGVETHKENKNVADVSVNEQETPGDTSSNEVTEETQTSNIDVIDEVEEETKEAVTEEGPDEQRLTEEAEEVEEIEEDEFSQLTKQLQAKEQEAKEHYDARLRLQAEFDNFKKRQEKELFSFRKYANEGLIQDILPIVDDFERAIAAAEQSHKLEDFLEGVELIFSKFLDALQKKGVKEIEAEGQLFNPEIHEAVTQIETDDVEEGTIVEVFQKGYYLHDRVIRAPKVGVAKGKD